MGGRGYSAFANKVLVSVPGQLAKTYLTVHFSDNPYWESFCAGSERAQADLLLISNFLFQLAGSATLAPSEHKLMTYQYLFCSNWQFSAVDILTKLHSAG